MIHRTNVAAAVVGPAMASSIAAVNGVGNIVTIAPVAVSINEIASRIGGTIDCNFRISGFLGCR